MTTPAVPDEEVAAAHPSGSRRQAGVRAGVLAGALAVHLAVLYWPRPTLTTEGLPLDKLAHAAIFAAVVVAAYPVVGPGRRLRWVAMLLVVHAGVSEAVQEFGLPHRSGDVGDALADVVGVLAAVAWIRLRGRWG